LFALAGVGEMASIFLSYVREDADKARTLAALLEREGHSVWWDRRIKGGSQFSAEIEAALKAAEKVIVLWSARSVGSAWVRDEAAVGRDSGRLVPVTIDLTEPPLGFRQYQAIALPRGKFRSGSPQMAELIEALGTAPFATSERRPSGLRAFTRNAWPWQAVAASLIVIAALAVAWWESRASFGPPTIGIVGVDDRSRDAARQLAVRLGELRSARSDAFQLLYGNAKADFVLQVDANDSPTDLRRDVSLLSGKNRSILWSAALQQPPAKADDLSQQLVLTSERALSCALEALSDRRDRIGPSTLKQYLGGCSSLEDWYGLANPDPSVWAPFEQVVTKAPHLRDAWSKLLLLESTAASAPIPPEALLAKLRAHIDQAQRLGMNVGALYVAKAALLSPGDFLGRSRLFDQAVATDGDDPLLLRMRCEWLQGVGRMNDAVNDAVQAAELDPLSPSLADGLLSALAYAGKTDEAFAQLRKAEATWPTARNIQFARYRLDLRFGDPKEALALYRTTMSGVDPVQESFVEARIDPTPAKVQRAIDEVRQENAQEPRDIVNLMQTLGQFGRKDAALNVLLNYRGGPAIGWNNQVLFRPALRDMWRDPRSIAAAAHVGLLSFWKKSGKWPDFCFDPTLPYDCKKEGAKFRV
jgi:tetratricopeptide (TPR) repeat protein